MPDSFTYHRPLGIGIYPILIMQINNAIVHAYAYVNDQVELSEITIFVYFIWLHKRNGAL